jgi:hypothetical protein
LKKLLREDTRPGEAIRRIGEARGWEEWSHVGLLVDRLALRPPGGLAGCAPLAAGSGLEGIRRRAKLLIVFNLEHG